MAQKPTVAQGAFQAASGKDSLYSLGVGEAEKLRNEIKELQELLRKWRVSEATL